MIETMTEDSAKPDANYRVVALTDEDGYVVERTAYTPYGEPTVHGGVDSGVAAELGNTRFVSAVGNPFLHQGLFRDRESLSYQNRFRQYDSRSGRFNQRDPKFGDHLALYEYLHSAPLLFLDALGLQEKKSTTKPPDTQPSEPDTQPSDKERVVQPVYDANDDVNFNTWVIAYPYIGESGPKDKFLPGIPIKNNSLEDSLRGSNDDSIDELVIFDHGMSTGTGLPRQQCGNKVLRPSDFKKICGKLKSGAKVKLRGCQVGKNTPYLCELVKQCRDKNITVCAYPVNVTGTGPGKKDKGCKENCRNNDKCK